MLNTFIKHSIEGTTYQGLEIFEANGKECFGLLVLENRKGELEVISENLVATFDALLKLLDKKKPLFITFNTSKVLKKQVATEISNNPELLVVNAFPNLEMDNFYYQILESENTSVVSISKKDHINWYLEQLKKVGLQPFQIALGISKVQILEGFREGAIRGSNFQVQFSKTLFEGYASQPEQLAETTCFDGISFQNWHVLGFAHILSYLQQKSQPSNLSICNQRLLHDFKNQKWFDFGVKFGLGFFLVLLLTNFLVFNHYHERNQELEERIVNNQNKDGALKALQKRIADKEGRLEGILNSKNSKTSYYLDELGKSVPNSVYLNDIQYQPLITPVRDQKAIDLTANSLQISGVTNEKIQFTVWSDNLETQKWVSRVEIMDYEYLSKSSANFTLKIVLDASEQEK
ncbi:MAG: PilN domain-containing protein [Bacteroidota bacterium]